MTIGVVGRSRSSRSTSTSAPRVYAARRGVGVAGSPVHDAVPVPEHDRPTVGERLGATGVEHNVGADLDVGVVGRVGTAERIEEIAGAAPQRDREGDQLIGRQGTDAALNVADGAARPMLAVHRLGEAPLGEPIAATPSRDSAGDDFLHWARAGAFLILSSHGDQCSACKPVDCVVRTAKRMLKPGILHLAG